jgi:predicted MFS family arabinose efflux permease
MGLTTSAILLGATVCSPVFGLIVEVSGTYRVAWLTLAALLSVAALLLWTTSQRPDPTAAAPEASCDEPAFAGR